MQLLESFIYSNKIGIRLLRHILFWLMHMASWLVVVSFYKPITPREFYYVSLAVPLVVITTYFIVYFLVPRFSSGNSRSKLFLWLMAVLFVLGFSLRVYKFYFLLPLLDGSDAGAFEFWNIAQVINEVFYWLGVICMATAIKLIKSKTDLQQKNEQLASEKRTAELNFLKLQMHPHFLFNTLNTLYSEIIQNSEKAAQVVVNLSSLLRFMLEESNKQYITLDKEIQIVKDYVNLEKLRHGERLNIKLSLPEDKNGLTVSPLLFLPFVENSFKHSLTKVSGKVSIEINIEVTNSKIKLRVANDCVKTPLINDRSMGKGVTNVRRQLELLYNKNHFLSIDDRNGKYIVSLEIPARTQVNA